VWGLALSCWNSLTSGWAAMNGWTCPSRISSLYLMHPYWGYRCLVHDHAQLWEMLSVISGHGE
jgi:hypothetical protein